MQKSVIEYLQKTVERFPEKTAVKDIEQSITFAELWVNAQKVSCVLQNEVGLNNPVFISPKDARWLRLLPVST